MYGSSISRYDCFRSRPFQQSQDDEPIVGTSASGLDLSARLLVSLQMDQVGTSLSYQLQSSAVTPTLALRPENQRALELLEQWMAEPDDLGEAWWDAFEQDLQQHRLSLREE